MYLASPELEGKDRAKRAVGGFVARHSFIFFCLGFLEVKLKLSEVARSFVACRSLVYFLCMLGESKSEVEIKRDGKGYVAARLHRDKVLTRYRNKGWRAQLIPREYEEDL